MRRRAQISSVLLFVAIAGVAGGLAAWKRADQVGARAAAAAQPEPIEVVTMATALAREHVRTTTAIGTVRALRSVLLRNELAGTVSEVQLVPGAIVEPGTLLIAFDVSVEEAELSAQEAQAALGDTMFGRMERALGNRGASETDVDRARAERDVAHAQVARTRAIIERKTIRAPFRARVGMADVHVGQYLNEGSELTTLQGIDDAVHVDFAVAQAVSAGLHEGDHVDVATSEASPPLKATIVAVDARVDAVTRTAWVRARIDAVGDAPSPGASVRVSVPVGAARLAVVVPVSSLRRGPGGDHVFAIVPDEHGVPRAHVQAVRTGPMLGDLILIEAGLAAGDQVAASGSFKLREGVRVSVAGDAGVR